MMAMQTRALVPFALSGLQQGWNSSHYSPKLFQVDVMAGLIRQNPVVYGHLYKNKLILDSFSDNLGDMQKVSVYFGEKEEAKEFRDLVNGEVFHPVWTSADRNPDDFTKLVKVKYGPDHKRITGEVS